MAESQKKTTATAVAKTEAKPPAVAHDYSDFAGYEDRPTADELLIPLLYLLQPMSPAVTENEVEGAKPGMYFNSVTGELVDCQEGLPFQPVYFDHMFVEWIPREKGGGIAARYATNDPLITKLKTKNDNSVVGLVKDGNDIVETYYVYGNVLSRDGTEVEGFAVLPIKSSSIKPLKAWRTAMQMVKGRPPIFAFRVLLKATREKNEKGTWWQFQVKPFQGGSWRESLINPQEQHELLEAGHALLDMIASGEAKADFSQEEKGGNATGSGEASAPF